MSNVQYGAFPDFKKPQNGYWITASKEQKDIEEKKYGKTIVAASLVAGFGTLALMKGAFPKTISKYLDKLKNKLAQKSEKSSKLQNFYRFSVGKIESFLAKTESVNNFTSLKDILFQKLMYGKNGERTFTRKIHQGITRFFDKISRKTVNSAYSNTNRKFASLNEYMTSINERLLLESDNPALKKSIDTINQRMQHVNANLDKGFGINARNARLRQMNEASDGLFDYFWNASLKDVRNFKSKNMYNSYIAEDYLLPAKLKISNETGLLRQAITHDIKDTYKATVKAVDNIQKFVSPKDTVINNQLNVLRNNLNKYKELAGAQEAVQRNALNQEIITNLRSLTDSFGTSHYGADARKAVSAYIAEVENIISKSSKGELQEVLTLYKSILPRNEYLKLKKQVNSAVSSLDKAIDTETNKYFDKARDLKLGSAPTDVLSILGTVGAVGWFLNKSDNKEERISASLKYGIPAVGAIATSLYTTAKLVAGGKALAFGLLSGWIINKIGVEVDNMRKKYKLDISLENKTILKAQPDKV